MQGTWSCCCVKQDLWGIQMKGLIRKSIHSIDEVREVIDTPELRNFSCRTRKKRVNFCGDEIKLHSLRYLVFFEKGMTCVSCGIQGRFFAKERSPTDKRYHLNLYAVNDKGEEVLMTKDHIIPVSLGGRNTLDNLQCMCAPCNKAKGNQM